MNLDLLRSNIDRAQRADRLSFADAVSRVRDEMASWGLLDSTSEAMFEQIVAERRAAAQDVVDLHEKSTAYKRDHKARGWYVPSVHADGVWESLRGQMAEGSLADALESINQSADSIVAHLAEPLVPGDKRRGLVIGNVQSGKTANYAAVIAKALDEGYRFIIVLSGVHNNLRRQTQRRLDRDLGVEADGARWFRLTSSDGDIGRADLKNAASILAKNDRVIAVVKKYSTRLDNLRDFLASADPAMLRQTPILIIDDESDQATPDSSSKESEKPSEINRRIKEIWSRVENGTYLGYTATPFANVFMDPDDSDGLYPEDFISVMPTSKLYFGAEQLFGISDYRKPGPDVVRLVGPDEVEKLVPSKRAEKDTFEPEVTKSLEAAIRWFIVASAVRRSRGQSGSHSTMLIHTTHWVEPHFKMRDAVKEFLEPLKERALNGDVEDFKDTFFAEINRAEELYTGDDAPIWPAVKAEIPNVLRALQVAVDNGSADEDERLSYVDEKPRPVIVIGGGTLSRGLTLEGLFVSFFTRTSSTYDTLLQMGRWFGYRAGYEDLQRIWVSGGLDADYAFLASIEAELRVEVGRMTAAGLTPGQIGVRIRQHPGRLSITSSNKMKHVDKVAVDFEGSRFQTTEFDLSDGDVLERNAKAVTDLISSLGRPLGPSDRSALLFQGADFAQIRQFASDFSVHPRFAVHVEESMKWTAEMLPEMPWNVVVASGSGSESFSMGEHSVKTSVRAPFPMGSAHTSGTTVDIRSLTTEGDVILDLVLSGQISPEEERSLDSGGRIAARKTMSKGGGAGLLVLYPISRFSKAKSSGSRADMVEVLNAIDPTLTAPDRPPLFGIFMIAPFDSRETIRSRGTYVAVQPSAYEEPAEYDEVFVDDERDFSGGGR